MIMIIATPLFIKKLTIEVYGVWMIINSLLHSFSMINIGGVDTVVKYISEHRDQKGSLSVAKIFSTVFIIQLGLASLIILSSTIIPEIIVKIGFLNIDKSQTNIFIGAFKYGILIFALKLLEQLILAYFKGHERFDYSSAISIISKLLLITIQILSALSSSNLETLFRNTFFIMLTIFIIEIIIIFIYSNYQNIFTQFDKKTFNSVIHYTGWSWATSLLGTISSQIDKWLIGSLADMKSLGYYSVCFMVFNNLHSITSASMNWVFPKTSNSANIDRLYSNVKKYIYIVFIISILGSGFLLIFDNIFYIWLKEDLYKNITLYMSGLIKTLPIFSISIIPFFSLKGRGFVKSVFISNSISIISRFTFIIILFDFFGLMGVVYSITLSGLFFTIYLVFSMDYKIFPNLPMKTYLFIIPAILFYLLFTPLYFPKIIIFILLILFLIILYPRETNESIHNLR